MAKKKKIKPRGEQIQEQIFQPHLKELRLAYKRMNSSPIKRLDWLLRFAYEDLSSSSAGQLSDRKWELSMFAGEGTKPEKLGHLLTHSYVHFLLPEPHTPAATDNFLKSFQEKMKANFQAFFSTKGWSNKKSEVEETLVFDSKDAEGRDQVQYTGTLWGVDEFLVNISFDL